MTCFTTTRSFDAHDDQGNLMYTILFRVTEHQLGSMVPGYPDEDYVTVAVDAINMCALKDGAAVPTMFIKNLHYDMLKVIYNKFVKGRKTRRAFWGLMRDVTRTRLSDSLTTVI